MEAVKERPEHTLQKNYLDKILKDSQDIAKAWQHKFIHTDTLWELLHKSRQDSGNKSEAVKQQETNWNKMLDALYNVAYNHCRENNLEYKFPLSNLKESIEILKDNITA